MNKIQCLECEYENPDYANFCVNCGNNISGTKARFMRLQKRLTHKSKDWIQDIRNSIDNRINGMLYQMDTNQQFKIGGINIPDNRKNTIRNALNSFQSKYGTEEEVSEDFKIWMDNLEDMLEEQKCIVCYSNWKKNDDIVVCKHCRSGGHKEHLFSWVMNNNNCPLCRQNLTSTGLIKIEFKEKINN